jgi:hypothetical protein
MSHRNAEEFSQLRMLFIKKYMSIGSKLYQNYRHFILPRNIQHFVPFRLKILNLDLTINNTVLVQPRPSTMAPTTPIHAIEGDASFGGYT